MLEIGLPPLSLRERSPQEVGGEGQGKGGPKGRMGGFCNHVQLTTGDSPLSSDRRRPRTQHLALTTDH